VRIVEQKNLFLRYIEALVSSQVLRPTNSGARA